MEELKPKRIQTSVPSSGKRPSGNGRSGGSRPGGQRPNSNRPTNSRSTGQSRPQGSRPSGSRPSNNRPSNSRSASNRNPEFYRDARSSSPRTSRRFEEAEQRARQVARRKKKNRQMLGTLFALIVVIAVGAMVLMKITFGGISENKSKYADGTGINLANSEISQVDSMKSVTSDLEPIVSLSPEEIERAKRAEEYAALDEAYGSLKPVKYDKEGAIAKLTEWAATDPRMQEILDKRDIYPDLLLSALASNPDLVYFALDWDSTELRPEPVLTEEEKAEAIPELVQWDPRWSYQTFCKESNVGLMGCGPTSMAMVVYAFTRDESVTPASVAAWATENDLDPYLAGASYDFFPQAAAHWGLQCYFIKNNEQLIKDHLDQGHYMIMNVRAGWFTAGGHYLVISGYDDEGFRVNDPNSKRRSSVSWKYADFQDQIKAIWVFSK